MPMTIAQRLAKLAKTPVPKPYQPLKRFQFIALSLVAYHLGGWRADGKESIREAYARGAGWESPRQMDEAMRHDLDAWNERHHAALVKMFGARGVDLDGGDPDKRDLVMLALIDEADKGGINLGG